MLMWFGRSPKSKRGGRKACVGRGLEDGHGKDKHLHAPSSAAPNTCFATSCATSCASS